MGELVPFFIDRLREFATGLHRHHPLVWAVIDVIDCLGALSVIALLNCRTTWSGDNGICNTRVDDNYNY